MDQRVGRGENAMPFPVGWRFAPTEEEVVMFLSDKAALRSLPAGIIKETDASDFFSKHPTDIGKAFILLNLLFNVSILV